MNLEVTAQFLDALAFFLVTPEFLGQQTLRHIRSHLTNVFEPLLKNEWVRLKFWPAPVH
jgi:hypothetical protein